MKNNLRMLFWHTRRGVGVALLALLAFTSILRADVVTLNNTGGSSDGSTIGTSGGWIAEQFQTGVGGDLTGLALQLNFTAASSANVYITSDLSTFTLVGTVSSGTVGNNQIISLSLLTNPYLAAGTSYLIALEPSNASVAWDYTRNSASGGDGVFQGNVYSQNSGVNWNGYDQGAYMQMNLTVVPEVPKTGMVMGFGALAIAMGETLRRKLRPAVANIA